MRNDKFIRANVVTGTKTGRKIGIPTINLDNPTVMKKFRYGVYSAEVMIAGKIILGSLFFGPTRRNGNEKIALEIHLFDFNQTLYEQQVFFRPLQFIRSPIIFKDLKEMKKTIEEDNRKIKSGKIDLKPL